MNPDLAHALLYRDRAKELRVKADASSPQNRKALLELADHYDLFAANAEYLMQSKRGQLTVESQS